MSDYEQTQASIYHLNDMKTGAGAARGQRVEDDIYSDIFSDDEDLTRIQKSTFFVEFPGKKGQKGKLNTAKLGSQNQVGLVKQRSKHEAERCPLIGEFGDS